MKLHISCTIPYTESAENAKSAIERGRAIRLLMDHEAATEGTYTEWYRELQKKYRDVCESIVDFMFDESELNVTTSGDNA